MKIHAGIYRVSVAAMLLQPVLMSDAQAQRTGTWLDSKAIPAVTETYVWSDEITAIRNLLEQGRKADALAAAQAHVEDVELTSLKTETARRYYAHNALCTVLTSVGRGEEAVAVCTTAMEIEPGKWSAVNNRGTAWLVIDNPARALDDYTQALQLAPAGNTGIMATIQHNISLARQRTDSTAGTGRSGANRQ